MNEKLCSWSVIVVRVFCWDNVDASSHHKPACANNIDFVIHTSHIVAMRMSAQVRTTYKIIRT